MGTIADAYESGGQKAKEGTFSNLVMLARVDGIVDEAEIALLKRVAQRLSLSPEQAKEIMNHPEGHPMIPPVEKEERFERLIQFIQMAFVDGVVDTKEQSLIIKYGVALGYSDEDAHTFAITILNRIKDGLDSKAILKERM